MPNDANGPVDDGEESSPRPGYAADMSAAAPLPPTSLMTAEELLDLPEDHLRHELVLGALRTMAPAGFEHGAVTMTIGARLHAFVAAHGLGAVLGAETGFTLARGPDTVRAPDVAFVRADRVPPSGARRGFAELAPDLVVEVVSPSDRTGEVTEKALMWVDAGVRLVWVVDPRPRAVTVYRPEGVVTLLRGSSELDGEDVLPGFRLPLGDLFD